MGNLFRMDADGANIHQVGKSTLHEGHAALMPDGRPQFRGRPGALDDKP
jgi:hypothetical protein